MIVLDASALVDVVIDQPTKPWVLEQVTASTICAPSHQMAEVLSSVARLVRAGVLEPGSARDALAEARALQQELVEPTEDHLVRALAMQDRVRVLDGLYVVLAEDRGVPLVATDRRFARGRLPVAVLTPDAWHGRPGHRGVACVWAAGQSVSPICPSSAASAIRS